MFYIGNKDRSRFILFCFYGSATNHLELGIWVGLPVCLNTNFKTSNLCLNDQAYNCLIHFSYHCHESCTIHDVWYMRHDAWWLYMMRRESHNYKLGHLDCLFWNLCWDRPPDQPRYRLQDGSLPNHKNKKNKVVLKQTDGRTDWQTYP